MLGIFRVFHSPSGTFVTEKTTIAGSLDLNNLVQCLFHPETTKNEF